MAARRRDTMGYGTAQMPSMKPGGFPLPPPPDGNPPVRLPIGGGARPPAQGMGTQPGPMQDTTGESDQQMLQLLKMLGSRQDQM